MCYALRLPQVRLVQKFFIFIGLVMVIRLISFISLDQAAVENRSSLPHPLSNSKEHLGDEGIGKLNDVIASAPLVKVPWEEQEAYDTLMINASTECPETYKPTFLRHRNKVWSSFINQTQEVHIYSAFFDDRPDVGLLPRVRLLSVSTPTDKPLYCQFWYDGIPNPVVSKLEIKNSGRGEKINGIKYGQQLYTCTLQYARPVPQHVSVSTSKCGVSTILVPIQVPNRGVWRHEFGVCVAIAFGEMPWHELIEWIELTHMQGAAEINVYNGSMVSSLKPLFDYYEAKGIVRMHQMPPPQSDYSKKGAKLGSPASLNDCMLRYMYRYKYIIIIDFDEIIVPRKDANYHDMLERIDKENHLDEPWMSYTFRNLYFFKDLPPEAGPSYNTMLRYRKRNKEPSNYLFAPKSFIDPRRCDSVFNHYCYIRFKNKNTPAQWTIDVSTDIAMSHHYRKCGFKKNECSEMIETSVADDVMLKFNSTINDNMQRTFQDLKYRP